MVTLVARMFEKVAKFKKTPKDPCQSSYENPKDLFQSCFKRQTIYITLKVGSPLPEFVS